MRHFADPMFWECLNRLPEDIQLLAHKNFELLKGNERHPSVRLKKVGRFWSARVGKDYRALAHERAEGLQWFWIGPHHEYDKFL
ncbi:type II toxin-antitoxin system RelE family toxin [Prosthecobacter sp.]|uniref:type II toxin-antitoxin system RelE family toxin n=1 Tax=Prosthecobacter sp. TaxID=1965333 RepID=UPI003BB18BE8